MKTQYIEPVTDIFSLRVLNALFTSPDGGEGGGEGLGGGGGGEDPWNTGRAPMFYNPA